MATGAHARHGAGNKHGYCVKLPQRCQVSVRLTSPPNTKLRLRAAKALTQRSEVCQATGRCAPPPPRQPVKVKKAGKVFVEKDEGCDSDGD